MIENDLTEPVWVARPNDLLKMVGDLKQHHTLAVDTESNSLFAYREQVCLIQFSTSSRDYLVDPLALKDLSALAPIFSNPHIEKVFHAAEYDLICLKRDFNFSFANLFDTMVASRILGRSSVGLGSLLKEEFDLDLDKRYQRANWGQRPLPPAQLAYARLDTHYLIALRDRMEDLLIAEDRWELAYEDFRRMEQVTIPESNGGVNGSCWKIAGNKELDARQMAVLHSLCQYRDRQAQIANLPLFKVLSNEVLVETALQTPTSIEELEEKVTSLSQRLIDRHGNGLVMAVQQGMEADPPHRTHNARPEEAFLARLDALRNWRKITGRALKVESDVVLPKDTMEMLAQANPRSMAELNQVMKHLPWRLEHFGEDILKVLL